MDDCIFCKIVKREIPSHVVYEDRYVLAFLDIQPVNLGHVLIIPKVHYEFIHEVDEEVAGIMFIVANRLNRSIRKTKIMCEGINYFLADGEAAMQEIKHTHLHCFPRYKSDGFGLVFSDKYHTEKPTQESLAIIAQEIESCLR